MSLKEVDPQNAWSGLRNNPNSILADVRTQAEWVLTGIPDLSSLKKEVLYIEWVYFPNMVKNDNFSKLLLEQIKETNIDTLYFLCRTGARSMAAASLMHEIFKAQHIEISCINITEGFEGTHDSQGHRGTINGWKAHDLPWSQS